MPASPRNEAGKRFAARLSRLRKPDEVVSGVIPECLAGGSWWTGEWPDPLRAGVLEPRQGYCFRPENLALAALLRGVSAERVVDLGSGSGSLLLIAHYFCRTHHALGIERQPAVAARLERTLSAHGLFRPDVLGAHVSGVEQATPELMRAEVLCGDLREQEIRERATLLLGGGADLVVTNPPFYPAGWGRPSKTPEVHQSTHALYGDVLDFLRAAAALLSPGGRVAVVFDAQRVHVLLAAAGEVGLGLERLLWIPDQRLGRGDEPTRVWCMLEAGGARIQRL